jgi:hypothetical protein
MKKTFGRSGRLTIPGFAVFVALAAVLLQSCAFPGQSDGKAATNARAAPVPTLSPRVQGLYEACQLVKGSLCLDRLKQMAAAGFTLVLNYSQLAGTVEQEIAYAKQAHSLGMKIIWAMNNPIFWDGTDLISYYSKLAKTCNCTDNDGFIRYVVSLAKGLPATWGYYIGDEVSPSDHDKLKVFTDLVKQIDPSHPRLFVAGASSPASINSGLAPFVDTADVLGVDYYPVGSDSMSISATGDVAHAVQALANQRGKQSVMVLQAFSWAQYPNESSRCIPFPDCARFPTGDDMRQMRDLVINNAHPQFILWYSFYNIVESDNPSGHWKDLVTAASSTQ